MKVYVYYDLNDGFVVLMAKPKHEKNVFFSLLGTINLPIEPIKKEVVKEINLGNNIYNVSSYFTTPTSTGVFNYDIPKDAYDRKITYKVKE
ncbi:MAG: hypothetical protein WC332_02315 [Clostridia bacterium]